jgi:signal transduction histidine kinase
MAHSAISSQKTPTQFSEKENLFHDEVIRPRKKRRQTESKQANSAPVPEPGQQVHERTARLQQINALLTEEIAERRRAEQALQQSQRLLRELGRHTGEIIEEERKRIARELHDQLGQNLMALRIDVLMMQRAAGEDNPAVVETVQSALNNIDSMIKNVRAIINNLRPAVLDLGLIATFEWEIKEFERRSGITCNLSTDRTEFKIDDARALALLRILQESLTNVARHANADHVEIRLHGDRRYLYLQVADNGVGDFPNCRHKANAFGLVGIQERVSALGGTVSIATEKGKGLTLTASVPLPLE